MLIISKYESLVLFYEVLFPILAVEKEKVAMKIFHFLFYLYMPFLG